jgi:predicted phage terminase large subunit-like protein
MLRTRLLEFFQKTVHESQAIYNWQHHARPSQLPPAGNWNTWLILAGRGFGKTRAGAETIRNWVNTQESKRIALIGQSLQEVRSVMVEGKSGLLAVSPPHERPTFEPSKNQLRWPCGALATLYGADYYEKLRGPEFDTAWVDELAKFRYAQEFWEQLRLSLRLAPARCIVTTTPRPIPLLTHIINDSGTVLTKGNTFENSANLSHTFLEQIKAQFDNTRLGQQELYAELLSEQQGALWSRTNILYEHPKDEFKRVVIAIDPATTHHAQSDETGIVVAALGHNNCVYVLDDISGRFSPNSWGEKVAKAYGKYGADRVVAEVNKGGDLVEGVLKTVAPHISYRPVRATRGKYTRAEPVAALYEQKKVFHIKPLVELEAQMCTYVPGITTKSPDRMDALVWAITSLMLESESQPVLKLWNE